MSENHNTDIKKEFPGFSEVQKKIITEILSRSDMGKVIIIGSGDVITMSHEARKELMMFLGVGKNGISFDMVVPSSNYQHRGIIGDLDIPIKQVKCFNVAECLGTGPLKKRKLAKNRLNK